MNQNIVDIEVLVTNVMVIGLNLEHSAKLRFIRREENE